MAGGPQINDTARAVAAIQAACQRLGPADLDGIAEFAIRLGVEKRREAVHRAAEFLREAAEMPVELMDFRTLLRVVVCVSGLNRDTVLRGRTPGAAKARHILFWLCGTYTALSTPQIGNRAERDHSTVLNGISRAQSTRERRHLKARANPVSWATVLWEAEWPPAVAVDGGRLARRRVPGAVACR